MRIPLHALPPFFRATSLMARRFRNDVYDMCEAVDACIRFLHVTDARGNGWLHAIFDHLHSTPHTSVDSYKTLLVSGHVPRATDPAALQTVLMTFMYTELLLDTLQVLHDTSELDALLTCAGLTGYTLDTFDEHYAWLLQKQPFVQHNLVVRVQDNAFHAPDGTVLSWNDLHPTYTRDGWCLLQMHLPSTSLQLFVHIDSDSTYTFTFDTADLEWCRIVIPRYMHPTRRTASQPVVSSIDELFPMRQRAHFVAHGLQTGIGRACLHMVDTFNRACGVQYSTLTDISSKVMCTEPAHDVSLKWLFLFSRGQTWYMSHGFVPCDASFQPQRPRHLLDDRCVVHTVDADFHRDVAFVRQLTLGTLFSTPPASLAAMLTTPWTQVEHMTVGSYVAVVERLLFAGQQVVCEHAHPFLLAIVDAVRHKYTIYLFTDFWKSYV